MSVQQPSDASNQYLNPGPSSSVPTPQAPFATSEFRKRVVEILSRTANRCLQELQYRPSFAQDLADIRALAAKFQNENQKLFNDNRQLAFMIANARAKQASMEQQIATLQRENQAILAGERNLAPGHPEYMHLQEECLRLRSDCTQLKQHITELQVYIPLPLVPNANLTQAPLYQQNRASTGSQPLQARIPQSVQDPLRQQQPQLGQGQNALLPPPPQNVSQSRRPGFHPSLPSIIIPNAPRTLTQVQANSQPNGGPPMQDNPQLNQDISTYRTPISAPLRSTSSLSAGSAGSADVNAQGHRMTVPSPIIQGWHNGAPSTNPHSPATMVPPHLVHLPKNPPRRQVSAPLPGSKPQSQPHSPLNNQHIQAPPHPQLHIRPENRIQPGHPASAPSSAIVSPIVPSLIANSRMFGPGTLNASAAVPFINPPQGMPTFAIGPPGKFLPSLAAYIKAPSPSTAASSLRSGPMSSLTPQQGPTNKTNVPVAASKLPGLVTPSTFVDPSRVTSAPQAQSPASLTPSIPHLNNSLSTTQFNSGERSYTPRLTPSSSRGSAGPSEGISEAMTPLDAVLSSIINVAESPTTGAQRMTEEPHPSTIAPSLLMKRSSMQMETDDDEVKIPLAKLTRKKPRLDEESEPTPSKWQTSTAAPAQDPTSAPATTPAAVVALSANGSHQGFTDSDVMNEDEDEDDHDDDDEIGPDGTRSISSCLDIFTEEDENGGSTCSLCISRHRQGLIAEPISFAPDVTQEEKVQHFLEEHPTSWDNLLHGTIAPIPG